MNALRKLASQTALYGIPSIAGRFLNYLLTYLYTRVFFTSEFGVNSELYAYVGFFNVLLMFGMETGYFRFQKDAGKPRLVYSTVLRFIIASSGAFAVLVFLFAQPLATVLGYESHPEYLRWFALILAMDAVGSICFAKLRAEEKAKRFATIKVIEIAVNIGLSIFFLVICRKAFVEGSNNIFSQCFSPELGIGYIFLINLAATAVKLLLLLPQMSEVTEGFDREKFKDILRYSLPMVVIGFAYIINEMLDRMILKHLLPYDAQTNLEQLGIYSACYKLAMPMTLFIQAFRYAGEPFFFSIYKEGGSRKVYAEVMHWFVLFCALVFLGVMLFIEQWQGFIGPDYRSGLDVVPILLLANLCLGVYTNLSIWYKLTDRTMMGAWISLMGAGITIVLNVLLIPSQGYMACAWATLASYGSMMVVSYLLGQKHFRVEYDTLRSVGYVALAVLFAVISILANKLTLRGLGIEVRVLTSVVLLLLYCGIVFLLERKNVDAWRRQHR